MTKDGLALRSYLLFSNIAEPLYRFGIKRRLKRDKENPDRYQEKFGLIDIQRPAGTVIWMHGVGLGEVLALRSLIAALQQQRNELFFLVTSSTRASADVFAANQPAHSVHQFLPVDARLPVNRFLDHWRPDLSVWAEQDLWPALVYHTHQRDIPLALVNARMNYHSYRSRARVRSLYQNLFQRFKWISAQDRETAEHMRKLGASVTVGGSLKASVTPLSDPVDLRIEFTRQVMGRYLWLLASSHREDETLAMEAHRQLLQHHPDALLIIAPRYIQRKDDIASQCNESGLTASIRSDSADPGNSQVYVADTFGEMGLWYRVCQVAFIGGSNSTVQGHNPWEAAALHCAVMHGPNTDNFRLDYQELTDHNAATCIENCDQIVDALLNPSLQKKQATNAHALAIQNNNKIKSLAATLLTLIENRDGR